MDSLRKRMLWIKQRWIIRKQTHQPSGSASMENIHQNESSGRSAGFHGSLHSVTAHKSLDIGLLESIPGCRSGGLLSSLSGEVPAFPWHIRDWGPMIAWYGKTLAPSLIQNWNTQIERTPSPGVIRKWRSKLWKYSCKTSRILFQHCTVHGCVSLSSFTGMIRDWGSSHWACNVVTALHFGGTIALTWCCSPLPGSLAFKHSAEPVSLKLCSSQSKGNKSVKVNPNLQMLKEQKSGLEDAKFRR